MRRFGALRDRSYAALPVAAAFGTMVGAALTYLAVNLIGDGNMDGWAIPIATDIAFALAALGLVGRRAPAELRTFLLANVRESDVLEETFEVPSDLPRLLEGKRATSHPRGASTCAMLVYRAPSSLQVPLERAVRRLLEPASAQWAARWAKTSPWLLPMARAPSCAAFARSAIGSRVELLSEESHARSDPEPAPPPHPAAQPGQTTGGTAVRAFAVRKVYGSGPAAVTAPTVRNRSMAAGHPVRPRAVPSGGCSGASFAAAFARASPPSRTICASPAIAPTLMIGDNQVMPMASMPTAIGSGTFSCV